MSAGAEGLFAGILSAGGAGQQVTDHAWLTALLEVEAGLAAACAQAGLIPQGAATAISEACRDAAVFDVAELGRQAALAGNPVVPLVRALEAKVGPTGAAHVHLGATSQDVLDTAMVLIARRAVDTVLADLSSAADTCVALASRHRDTAMVGRTLLQQALPTTFGLTAAGWFVALDHAAARLSEVSGALPVQLGGAVGTLDRYGGQAEVVLAELAAALGLPEPVLPWHTARGPLADLSGALGAAAGAVGKVALDVCLLAQGEVGEVREGTPGRGRSSAMPHKANPVAAVSARAAAIRTPGLVATLLATMAQEHDRAAGAWQAEWETLDDLLRVTGSSAAWLRDSLGGLEVDAGRMARNLATAGSELAASELAGAIVGRLGRSAAQDLVAGAVARSRAAGTNLQAELAAELPGDELERLIHPSTGQAGRLVDRAIERRRP